jgi:hypothetical protein
VSKCLGKRITLKDPLFSLAAIMGVNPLAFARIVAKKNRLASLDSDKWEMGMCGTNRGAKIVDDAEIVRLITHP